MNISKIIVGVFVITFAIGVFFAITTNKFNRLLNTDSICEMRSVPRSEKEILKNGVIENKNSVVAEEFEANFIKETPTPKVKDEFKPEIFGIIDDIDSEMPAYKMKLVDMVETANNFDKDEIVAKSGQTWLGLFEENGEYQLRKTTLQIVPETRENFGSKNSITIKTTVKSEPYFLLKNAKNINESEITTLYKFPSLNYKENDNFDFESRTLNKNFAEEFQLGDRKYNLKVKFGLTNQDRQVSVLILESGETSQIVTFNSFYESGDNIGTILWAGDLDRDGKLDFYISHYGFEKGGVGLSLYLSSQAEKGKLVKEVAVFGTAGC